jgi:hypothetical protein
MRTIARCYAESSGLGCGMRWRQWSGENAQACSPRRGQSFWNEAELAVREVFGEKIFEDDGDAARWLLDVARSARPASGGAPVA